MGFTPEEWDKVVGSWGAPTTRLAPPTSTAGAGSGRAVAQVAEPEPQRSRFSRAADVFRAVVPQTVRDVGGRTLRAATQGSRFLDEVLPGSPGTAIKEAVADVPLVGGLLAEGLDIATAPTTLLTAGYGAAIQAPLRAAGPLGKLAALLLSPASRSSNAGVRLFSETVMGTSGVFAAEKAAEATDSQLVGAIAGVAGALVAGGGLNVMEGAGRSVGRNPAKAISVPVSGRKFLEDLLPAQTVAAEIKPAAAGSFEASSLGKAANTVIDPSRDVEGPIGVAFHVHNRQVERGSLLTEVSLAGAVDSHARGAAPVAAPGGSIFDVDNVTGKIKNVPGTPDLVDFVEQRRSVQAKGLRADQRAFLTDVHTWLDELNAFRKDNGLKAFKNPDAELAHVTRIVRGIREIDEVGRTNSFLERVYETRAQGIEAGVKYENDLRSIMGLMGQATYREAAAKQMEELLKPSLVTPKTVLLKTRADIAQARTQAAKDLIAARRTVRGQRNLAIGTRAQMDKDILRTTREMGRARQNLASVLGRLKGQEDIQARLPNADRKTLELYQSWQAADDAAARFATVSKQANADGDSFANASRELVSANKTLSRVLGEIAERGRLRGTTKQGPGFELLTATRGKLTRLDAAQKRVANAEQLVKDTKPDTSAARTAQRELVAAQKRLARVQGAQEAEAAVTARLTSTPTAYGRRLADAQKRLDDVTSRIEQMQDWRKDIPAVRTSDGPAITPAAQTLLADAKAAAGGAKKAYRRELESIKGSRVLPGYIFGRSERDIAVGTWKGKFLPADADYLKLAEKVSTITGQALPAKIDPFTNSFQQASDVIRLASATGDAAAPFVHGLPLLGRNPLLWAKATKAQYRGMMEPAYVGRYIKQNLATVQEMARYGVPVGDIEQYIAASEGRGLAAPVHKFAGTKVGRQSLGRLEAGMDGFLTTARTELWKSLRPLWDGTPDELATYVRDATGALSTKALGVGPHQRAYENVWLAFSPRLMRSTLALVAHAANPDTAVGRQAARSLLGIAAVGSLMATATNLALSAAKGENEEQAWHRIGESLNPTGGSKFLSVDIGGQRVGVGGQVRAITQFVAKSLANPAGFASAGAYENPLINFYMGRGAVGVNIAGALIEGATDERINVLPYDSIDSLPDVARHFGTSLVPFALQAQIEARDLSKIDRVTAGLTSFGGLSSNEKSPTDRINDEAKARWQKPYSELTGVEQQTLEADRADLFALRDQQRDELGGREAKLRTAKLKMTEDTRLSSERALVDAFQRGTISATQFRDEIKAVQRDAAVLKRGIRGPFEEQAADTNKQALSAWYDTFDQAKVPGTEIVDWDAHEAVEKALLSSLTPEQRRYVDERRVTPHAEEAAWYFDNEKVVQQSDYYGASDRAFEQYREMMPAGIDSYGALVIAKTQATTRGDTLTARLLTNLKNRVDAIADREKRRLRIDNLTLDRALQQNGRVSTLMASNR